MPCPEAPAAADWPALILDILRGRDAASTACPSEVARRAGADWRACMDPVRDAARALARQGRIRVLQRGEELDPRGAWRGAIRLARGPRFDRPD